MKTVRYTMLVRQQYLVLLALLCFAWPALCQNTIGIPTIVNYSRLEYSAGNQNWNIAQDSSGIMYFANNDGLLSFDGTSWRTYPLPNKTIVRSMAMAKDGRIYIGGQEEIGYFAPDANGELAYTSLKPLLDKKDYDFADVWNVFVFNNSVFFRSNRRLFEYNQEKIIVHTGNNWIYLGSTGKELLAYEYDLGLVGYSNGRWVPRAKYGRLPQNALLRAVLEIGKDSILLPTMNQGLYILHHDTVSSFVTPDLKAIAAKNISGACVLGPDRIAITTNTGGCIVINKKGQFIQRFTKEEGVQNNNVLGAFLDKDKNLWFGLDNGIDLVVYSNAIKHIFPDLAERNAGYTSMLHKGYLYLGVSNAVYRIRHDVLQEKDLSYTQGRFELVDNTRGQVWALSEVNGELFLGHHKGAFVIRDGKAIHLDDQTGYWKFQSLYPHGPSPAMVAGTYKGLNFYDHANGVSALKISAPFESARYVIILKNEIWNAHPYKGLYKIIFNDQGQPVISLYEDKKGFLSRNHNQLFKIRDKMILTTDNGIFEYDEVAKDFARSAFFEKMLGGKPVNYLKEDKKGNIWFCRGKRLGVIDMSEKEPRVVFIAEIDDKIMAGGFQDINIIDSANVLVAAEKGFFHINYAQYKQTRFPLKVLIRSVQSSAPEQGLLFGGYGRQQSVPSIAYQGNSVRFEFSSIIYGQKENSEYSFYLQGFDKGWSEWVKRSYKDYTNLPEGSYTFHVKTRNNIDSESPVTMYSFTILPPWYRTWWAYALYVLAFGAIIYYLYKRQQHKYRRQQQQKLREQQRKYQEKQQQLQYQHQLEMEKNEKEIIRLRNEKLQAEVQHKNTELASSAMNLVRKMEILSKLKEDLLQYKANPDKEKGHKEFQKIIKVLDSELDNPQEWEQFAVHFDSVHSNYLKKLKEHCPDLTVTELKLAAYLRLNLTSKEIAQLMNISIRGVETSRYRLRKKLALPGKTNLADFLLQVAEV
ncbi:MAG TPA: triple tyrosine motif-containing protein [Chitinophagaceae bacterium]|nr:triple tyrosine motif-containing protein [Chitinophagaceae bacterium]